MKTALGSRKASSPSGPPPSRPSPEALRPPNGTDGAISNPLGFALGIEEQLNIFALYFAKGGSIEQDSVFAARERAIQLMSELVGAVILSRAVAHANPSLSDEILQVSRRNILGKGATRTRSRRLH